MRLTWLRLVFIEFLYDTDEADNQKAIFGSSPGNITNYRYILMKSVKTPVLLAAIVMINLLMLIHHNNVLAEPSAAGNESITSGYASVSAVHFSAFSALKSKNYRALAEIVHPVKGVRFSINGYVSPKTDIVLNKNQLKDKTIGVRDFKWGTEGGSGSVIVITLNQFMDRFNRDFENPAKSGHNKRVTTAGISDPAETSTRILEGSEKLYANSVFEESFFRGQSGLEFDWDSFIMVFELHKENYYLVGIIHNHWLV